MPLKPLKELNDEELRKYFRKLKESGLDESFREFEEVKDEISLRSQPVFVSKPTGRKVIPFRCKICLNLYLLGGDVPKKCPNCGMTDSLQKCKGGEK